ncbi:MAG: S-layer homology domain-containing protein [Ruminococcaceae bacterium]|nr:S-layer homology domain-containing protein [Oscillospiraceae bacterium]
MKNLKKTLAVVLAFAMVLSMGFSAFAYTDVAEGTKVAEAVGILSNLGIFEGFEDGTFKPNDTVTRAQMAAIICRTLGYEDQAKASMGSTIFNDVPASHWASGYVNVAQSLQIVNGYGNGNFGPEDQVTYEQAIKMIVVALGYELDAQSKGGWSTGYLAVASREGISKNSNGVVGAPAARGTIAVLVYNSLEVRLMDQKSWTPSGEDDAYGKLDETILSQYLGIRKVEGIVAGTPFAEYAENGYTEDSDAEITFMEGAEYFEYVDGKLEDKALEQLTYDASLVADVNNFAGRKVVAYVGEEEDDETGNYMIYAIAEKQGANKVTTLSATQLVDEDEKYGDDEAVIGYREVGATKIQSLDLETDEDGDVAVTVVNNFVIDGEAAIATTADLKEYVGNGIVTLISNDADSKIDVILVTVYDSEAVVEEVTTDDGVVMFDCYVGDIEDIDTEDEDYLSVVIKDGAVATAADIAANDTVSKVEAGDNFVVYYVSSKTVTGKVDSYDDDCVEIGGEEYEISSFAAYEDISALSGKEGIFFINVDGQIAHDEATSDVNYGIVIAAGTEDRKNMVEVVLADGTAATYELGDKAKLGEATTDDDVLAALEDMLNGESNGWAAAELADINSLVFDITIKNGKVTKLVAIDAEDEDITGREYDEENMEYGNLVFNDSTVVIAIDDVEDVVESDDIKVGKVADFFVDGEGEDFVLAAYDYDNNDVAGLVVGTGLTTAVSKEGAAFIVTGYKTKDIDDEDAYVINGFQDGKKASYTILDEDLDGEAAALFVKGNILLVGAANADGIITDLELLATRDGLVIADGDCKEDEYYFFGALDETEAPTASKFYLADADVVGDTEEDGAVITMKNSARYTLVDFSEGSTPEVSKKSKGTSLFSRYDGKYDYTVFVRYFDKDQVEVIVYRDAEIEVPEV